MTEWEGGIRTTLLIFTVVLNQDTKVMKAVIGNILKTVATTVSLHNNKKRSKKQKIISQ